MRRALALAGWIAPTLLTVACSNVPTEPLAVRPPRLGWESVSEMLGVRCGSLDCHGRQERPLRLFNNAGMRLAMEDAPGESDTTQAEHEANLRSVVGLEPESFAHVIAEGGRDPERLTLVRKGLGLENHKGGTPLTMGSAGASCLRSWLAGTTDGPACVSASEWDRPEP